MGARKQLNKDARKNLGAWVEFLVRLYKRNGQTQMQLAFDLGRDWTGSPGLVNARKKEGGVAGLDLLIQVRDLLVKLKYDVTTDMILGKHPRELAWAQPLMPDDKDAAQKKDGAA
jgi:hypothetical protein